MDNIRIISVLGAGSFSKVLLATHNTGAKLCVKVIQKSTLNGEKDLQHLSHEISVLSSIRHPNIVSYYGMTQDEAKYVIFMEYCEGVSLLDYIRRRGHICETTARKIARDLLSVLAFLHKHNIYHRDIKPENIMIMPGDRVKVIDFGLCSTEVTGNLNTFCGSLSYTAPEILQKRPYDGAAVDIWSAGIVIYAMVCGKLPWAGNNVSRLLASILYKDIPAGSYSKECEALIRAMLNRDPTQRPSASEALDFPWLKGRLSDNDNEKPTGYTFTVPTGVRYSKRTLLTETNGTKETPDRITASSSTFSRRSSAHNLLQSSGLARQRAMVQTFLQSTVKTSPVP